ncbi:MAG: hypothetical protein RLZZ387_1966 [Chloroflexota bacterium]
MPDNNGMAFVVIRHLSPDHASSLAEVLQRSTAMPVCQVTEPVRVVPETVYVIPPTKQLLMDDGKIVLTELDHTSGRRAAIDLIFRTLAETHTTHVACIVLSGAGADGSVGITRAKEAGGITIAQDPREAEHESMPRSAINTGMIDFVLPVAEMPTQLLAVWHNAQHIALPSGGGAPVKDDRDAAEEALRDVLATVRERTGHDFAHYKRPTALRRIARRMQITTTPDLPAYRDYLKAHLEEVTLLLRDLLINVTNFFRDRAAFDTLAEEAIPLLFAGKAVGDTVRVWVAGCASGEEAYSLAILLLEYAVRLSHPQVFATDIDEGVLHVARTGSYSEAIAADVAPDRLRRFFTRTLGGYSITPDVRDRVVFATHNLIADPPFSRLDLVSCRNVLSYLSRTAQEQVLGLFRFALRPNGFLFLGAGETPAGVGESFTPVVAQHRLYRVSERAPGVGPTLSLRLPARATGARVPTNRAVEREQIAFSALHQRMLERYASPSVLVNAAYEVVHLSERAGRFVQPADGALSFNLLRLVRPELRAALSAALVQAFQTGRPVTTRWVHLGDTGEGLTVRVVPERDTTTEALFALVLFDEGAEGAPAAGTADTAADVLHLQHQLDTVVAEHSVVEETLRATNEELLASNEELRATTEELGTSKEELQSINEELLTVNQELKHKVDEVSRAHSDLQNLMTSTAIGTIFVDRELRIKRYTPSAQAVINLIATDVNRPLAHLTHQLDYDQLLSDVTRVLALLAPIEREVASRDGRWYLLRIQPYRTETDQIDGVVLTFVDITQRRAAEVALRASEERLRLLIESVQDYAILTVTPEGRVAYWNTGAERMFGYAEAEIVGQDAARLFVPEDRAAGVPTQELQQALKFGRAEDERWHVRKDGSRFYASVVMTPIRDSTVRGFAKVMRDLTARKQVEEVLHRAHDELERRALERTEALVTAPERQAERIVQLQDITNQLDRDIQRLARELRPRVLDMMGLVPALEEHVTSWSEQTGVQAQLAVTGYEQAPVSPEVAAVLYRVVQEALTNVLKHAGATTVGVVLQWQAEWVQITVEDNGRGIPSEVLVSPATGRLGLMGMRERVELLGGTLDIEAAPDNGTRLIVRVPLPPSAAPPPGAGGT